MLASWNPSDVSALEAGDAAAAVAESFAGRSVRFAGILEPGPSLAFGKALCAEGSKFLGEVLPRPE